MSPCPKVVPAIPVAFSARTTLMRVPSRTGTDRREQRNRNPYRDSERHDVGRRSVRGHPEVEQVCRESREPAAGCRA
jgi:hypothetical protein